MKISNVLTFYSQFARCRVATDAVGRYTLVLALILGEYFIYRESGHSVFIFEVDDLRRTQGLQKSEFYRAHTQIVSNIKTLKRFYIKTLKIHFCRCFSVNEFA